MTNMLSLSVAVFNVHFFETPISEIKMSTRPLHGPGRPRSGSSLKFC